VVLYLSAPTAAELRIWHFNVGQADCTFLLTPSGVSVLFDCGELSSSSTRNVDRIAGLIEEITGKRHLDYFVLSHFHVDHVGCVEEGGLWGLLETHQFTVQTLSVRDVELCPGNSGRWVEYLANNPHVGAVETALVGDAIDLSDGVSLKVYSANGEPRTDCLSENACSGLSENDLSVGMLVSYGEFQEWIGGDLSGVSEGSYKDVETFAASLIGDIEVLRVNHHGSPYSTNRTFLANLDPEVSIISVGVDNRYGHPDPDVVVRLCDTSDVFMTSAGTNDWANCECTGSVSTSGGVYVETDGHSFSVVDLVTDQILGVYLTLPIDRADADSDGYYADVDLNDSDPEIGVTECTTLASES